MVCVLCVLLLIRQGRGVRKEDAKFAKFVVREPASRMPVLQVVAGLRLVSSHFKCERPFWVSRHLPGKIKRVGRPYDRRYRLPEIDLSDFSTELRPLADRINRLRDRLDDLLFGFQDYAVVGAKPTVS